LGGALDYLFIAPERLRVPGFPEMLAKRKPTLIAVDEAHCISQWGHDFRPDYRMLKERLPILRPTPIVALTATATGSVQQDIMTELALERPHRFVHGFVRENLAIECVNAAKSVRAGIVHQLLVDSASQEHLPAIVYALSRRETEELAAFLSEADTNLEACAYHAGMGAAQRDDVYRRFANGELDVIVATIAFGMGIDKSNIRTVIHTAMPGSVENYYQEIGRAGRDGQLAKALLLYSWADLRTQEFLYEKNYPDVALLDEVHRALSADPKPREEFLSEFSHDDDVLLNAIDKLWLHGGLILDHRDQVSLGPRKWNKPYQAQRVHKKSQLDRMIQYAQSYRCRMVQLVGHFGEEGEDCGLCDVCSPETCVVKESQPLSPKEQRWAGGVLATVWKRPGITRGQLFREEGEPQLSRGAFEERLGALICAGLLEVEEDWFEKDGKHITFDRLDLTNLGRKIRVDVSRLSEVYRAVEPWGGSGKGKGKKSSFRATNAPK